jgi:signal transduction histidine kinase
MRVGRKIALVGGVPIFIAAAIAVAGWFLLAQEERARGGAVLAGQVHHNLTLARLIRDEYVGARPSERTGYAERFARLTGGAGDGLGILRGLTRTADQTARITSAQVALNNYVARMNDFTQVTRESDGLIAEMAQRADTLIALSDQARLRQQASNADLVQSLSDKVNKLRATRDVVAGIYALQATIAPFAGERVRGRRADAEELEYVQLRNASRDLTASLRAGGRAREADELNALMESVMISRSATADVNAEPRAPAAPGTSIDPTATLMEWGERILKIDTSGQGTLHEEVAQLLTYSIEANETEQATQNIAISTLKLGQRTANALVSRDAITAAAMLDEGEHLSKKAAALPISPLIQSEMIDAIDGWRTRLATTIAGLRRQGEMLADMDGVAEAVSQSARALNDAFIDDADSFGTSIRQILLVGAGLGLLAGSLAALAVARSITVPLQRLQGDMVALAANPAGGNVAGTGRRDELGDIARATAFFVTEIARRERALRRAKEQADTALIDLRQAQDNLIRAEKLASLGELVAGVAHEINTPLGIALTTATTVRDETRAFQAIVAEGTLTRSRLTHFTGRVSEGASLLCANLSRAADLVHGFKQIAVDRASDEHRSFALDVWLDELLASLQPLFRQNGHTIERECPPGLIVDTNPGALAQVVTNLVANAITHAFEKERSGRISVRVVPAAAEFIRLEVADDGCGIAPADLSRIFDPFFTTARSRGSTGLGMHIVHNLVTVKLNGRIAVQSEPPRGTIVSVEFPVSLRASEDSDAACLPAEVTST